MESDNTQGGSILENLPQTQAALKRRTLLEEALVALMRTKGYAQTTVTDICREAGIPCIVVPEQTLGGVTVSSTHIRGLMEAGEMEQAVRFLGHPHIPPVPGGRPP